MTLTITTDVDSTTWDDFVAHHDAGSLLQSAAWARFKADWKWENRRLLVMSDDSPVRTAQDASLTERRVPSVVGTAPVAGAQMLLRRLPLGRSLAYIPRGPVVSPDQQEVQNALWPALHELAKEEGALLLTIEPNWQMKPDEAEPLLHEAGFERGARDVQPRATLVVDLRPSEDDILMEMKSKWRYNIRLSGRKDVVVRAGDESDFGICYDIMEATGERNDFDVRPRGYYESAWDAFQPDGSRLFIAEYDGTPLAWLMAFHHGPTAYYLYGASSSRERNRMPNHALQWAAMRWAKESGCTHYDLWGIPPEVPEDGKVEKYGSGGLWGVYRFKRGFGGSVVKYPGAFDAVYNKLAYQFYKTIRSE